ncbi:MAG: sulfotransferase family 2 domain-containing protein, partial [Pseudomonadota bacterium]
VSEAPIPGGEAAPCPPQHMHYALVAERADPGAFDARIAVVRHPLSRFVSEYKYRVSTARRRHSFEFWAWRALARWRRDPFHLSNHLRPQSDFVGDDVAVFRFEDGLERAYRAGLETLEVAQAAPLGWEKKSAAVRVAASPRLVAALIEAYRADFERFDYDPAAATIEPPQGLAEGLLGLARGVAGAYSARLSSSGRPRR